MLTLIQLLIWQAIGWYLTIRMPLKPRPHLMEMNKIPTTVCSKTPKSFHRLSGHQDCETRTSACHELINLVLSQTSEDKHLINVTAARTKTDEPFHSNLEMQPELKKKQEKLHLQWPPIKKTQRIVVNRTLGLYQHGRQPKASSSSYQWPPPAVENPGTKSSHPRTFPPPIRFFQPHQSTGNYMRTPRSCSSHQPALL